MGRGDLGEQQGISNKGRGSRGRGGEAERRRGMRVTVWWEGDDNVR